MGVNAVLANVTELVLEINLEVNTRKRAWWLSIRANAINTSPTLLPSRRPECLSLLSVPFEQVHLCKRRLTLLGRQANMPEGLVKVTDKDPHVPAILLHFYVGPRFNYWLRSLQFDLEGKPGGR